ncbi:MAG: hypothetical protein KDB34_07130 [Propionibacteriaceae bacterium]|nr:hypothetical protein [Propionibacteriaceae bacterium]
MLSPTEISTITVMVEAPMWSLVATMIAARTMSKSTNGLRNEPRMVAGRLGAWDSETTLRP